MHPHLITPSSFKYIYIVFIILVSETRYIVGHGQRQVVWPPGGGPPPVREGPALTKKTKVEL